MGFAMSRKPRRAGRPALDLIEDAVHLLRTAPAGTLAVYYLGALPFVLAFLFFWSDMSRSAFARERLEPLAAVLAVLFVWLKLCQGAFARRLWAQVSGVEPRRGSFRERFTAEAGQLFWHATGFVILPVAFVLAIPFGWCFAFYQCLPALSGVEDTPGQSLASRAGRHARLWAGQNHILLGILLGAGCVVFLNVCILLFALPYLLKTLAGVETSFTQSWWAMLNTTFMATAAAITWLALDPLIKASYVLRCFHGEAIHTGEDIRAELRAVRQRRLRGAVALLAGLLLPLSTTLGAESAGNSDTAEAPVTPISSAQPTTASASPQELDRALDDVLQRREFTWRMPREQLAEAPPADNWFNRALERIFNWIAETVKSIGRSVFEILRWIMDKLFGEARPPGTSGTGWADATRGLFILLLVALAAAIGYLLYRLWKNYRQLTPEVVAPAAPATPDLNDDSVTAAQLPEDEWLRLARELMARGEFRLALRAMYLAGLAHLAGRGLLTIARHKSNLEYARELGRRGHALPEVLNAFTRSVTVFDRVWYGSHEATREVLADLESNVQQIRTS